MSRINKVEGNVSNQKLKLAEQEITAMQEIGYVPLAIMYYLVENYDFSVSLTGCEDGYVATIS